MWQPRFDWELLLVEKTIITGSSTWKLLNSRLDLKKVIDISDEMKCFIKQLKRQICRNPLPILIWKTTWKPMFCFLKPFFDSTNDTRLTTWQPIRGLQCQWMANETGKYEYRACVSVRCLMPGEPCHVSPALLWSTHTIPQDPISVLEDFLGIIRKEFVVSWIICWD